MTLVYLDTETTGLDPDRHQVWEIAYAIDDGPVESSFVGHSVWSADPKALELNGYHDRFVSQPQLGLLFERILRHDLEGATLVGANPAFDAAFLRRRWGVTPWRYRLLDVEAYGAGVLGLVEPIGLKGLTDAVRALGYEIPEPDHTAAADVRTLRRVHQALVDHRQNAFSL